MTFQYIAGFFDGEGCIGLYERKRKDNRFAAQFLIEVVQASPQERVLFEIQNFLAEQGIDFKIRSRTNSGLGYQELFKLYSTNPTEILNFLVNIEPYLVVKVEKARQVIEILKAYEPGPRGATKQPVKSATVKRIVYLREEGMSQREIAEALGGSWHQVKVSRILRNLTIPV